MRTEGKWTRLELTTATGEFAALLPAGESADYLQDAMVRVRGVCTVATGAKQEASEVELWLQNLAAVVMDEPPAREPFALPLQGTASLRRFSSMQAAVQQVRVSGMVLLHEPGRYLCLQDGDGGLLVLSRGTPALLPGTWIDVVGIPGREGNRLALREGMWRIAPQSGTRDCPRELPAAKLLDSAVDIHLVRVAAVLRQTVREGSRVRLGLEAEGTVFEAMLPASANWVPPVAGSRLELTGVCVLEFDDYRRIRGYRLELRSPADVVVLVATPSWWTAERMLYIAGILATGSAADFALGGRLAATRAPADGADPRADGQGSADADRAGARGPARIARCAGWRHRT